MSSHFPKPPFPEQQQPTPGKSALMDPPKRICDGKND
jgi:hypothetical protein